MRSPSRSASASRRNATRPTPSPSIVPSACAENGRQSPEGESAGVFVKHIYMKMSFSVSTPPVITRSLCPSWSSCTPIAIAARLLAHAASTVQLVPPRSKRLARRPAATLASRPGKVASFQSGYCAKMRSQIGPMRSSDTPSSRSACTQNGRWILPAIWPMSSVALLSPSITLMRRRSIFSKRRLRVSWASFFATTSGMSCAVSVLGSAVGGRPNSIGSNSTGSRKAPRRA